MKQHGGPEEEEEELVQYDYSDEDEESKTNSNRNATLGHGDRQQDRQQDRRQDRRRSVGARKGALRRGSSVSPARSMSGRGLELSVKGKALVKAHKLMDKLKYVWLSMDLVLHGEILSSATTPIVKRGLSSDLRFNHSEWMTLMQSHHGGATTAVQLKDLPLSSRVRFTVWACKERDPHKNKRKKRKAKGEHELKPYAVGGVSISIYDHRRVLRSGMLQLRLWSGRAGELHTACVENTSKNSHLSGKGVATLHIKLDDFPRCVRYALPPVIPRGVYQIPLPKDRPTAKLPKQVRADVMKETLDMANHYHPLSAPLTNAEKKQIWQARFDLASNPAHLPVVLRSVNWQDPHAAQEAYDLLSVWSPMSPLQSLELLGHRYGDYRVRQYAVRRLEEFTDTELGEFVLQLTQALKVEPFHRSPLAFFLIRRALASPELVGQTLFWQLRSEMHNPRVAERFGVLLRSYLVQATHHRNALSRQNDVQNFLKAVADDVVVKSKAWGGGEKLDEFSRTKLTITNGLLPADSQLCLDPRLRVSTLIIDKCKVMNSKKKPLWLAFNNVDALGDKIMVMFKSGDDLRQDQMTLQIIRFVDALWIKNGLDLRMSPYRCVSTGNELGMLEIVTGANTIANIQKDHGGYTGAFDRKALRNWLMAKNLAKNKEGLHTGAGPGGGGGSFKRVVDNFVHSCAGYCVISYVLGIGDRHADNIMLKEDGHLFHIDFGHYLGNFKTKLGFKRERTPFVFTREMAYVMHGGKKNTAPYKLFCDTCAKAFNILRQHSRTLIVLFQLMIPAGIPELTRDTDIEYMKDKLHLKLTDEQAGKLIKKEIKKCLNDYYRIFDNWVHNIKTGKG
jgi:phosphatidylinositol-4,5-bisphosphate 3-kinase